MEGNQQPHSVTWGYVWIVIAIVTLAFALALPHTPVSIAQEATRPAPGPTRPAPAPTRDTPPSPTSPPGTPVTPGPSPTESPATAVTPVLPDSGGVVGDSVVLLAVGLALAIAGVGVNAVCRRVKNDK